MSKVFKFLVAVLVSLGVIFLGLSFLPKFSPSLSLGGNSQDHVSYDALGSASSPVTLISLASTATSTQKVLFTEDLENLHLDIKYTPATSSAYLALVIEGSNDGGQTYFPLSSKQVNTTETKLYTTSTLGFAGNPVLMPGDLTAASGTTYLGMYDSDLVADHVRITARENATSNFGTAYIRATFSVKK